MNAIDIDPMAVAGYEYATKTGTHPRTVTVKTDMDLLAFNAGISNANLRHGLAVAKIAAPRAVQVQKQRDALQVLLNLLIAKIKSLRTGQELVCNSFMLLGYDAYSADGSRCTTGYATPACSSADGYRTAFVAGIMPTTLSAPTSSTR